MRISSVSLLQQFVSALGAGHGELASRFLTAYLESLARSRGQSQVVSAVEEQAWQIILTATAKPILPRTLPDSLTRRICADFGSIDPRRIAREGIPSDLRGSFSAQRVGPNAIFAALAVWLEERGVQVHVISREVRSEAALVQRNSLAGSPRSSSTLQTTPLPPRVQSAAAGVTAGKEPPHAQGPAAPPSAIMPPAVPAVAASPGAVIRLPRKSRPKGTGKIGQSGIVFRKPNGPSSNKRSSGLLVPRVAFVEQRLSRVNWVSTETLSSYRSSVVTFFSWLCHDLKLEEGNGEVHPNRLEHHRGKLLAAVRVPVEDFVALLQRMVDHLHSRNYSVPYQRMFCTAVRAFYTVLRDEPVTNPTSAQPAAAEAI